MYLLATFLMKGDILKYYHNSNYGLILYPTNWWDVFRNFATWIIHPKAKRTWRGNPNWKRPHVIGCIEIELTETNYPDECSCG